MVLNAENHAKEAIAIITKTSEERIEAEIKQIAALLLGRVNAPESVIYDTARAIAEIAALSAADAVKVEPVAMVVGSHAYDGIRLECFSSIPVGTKLYAAPPTSELEARLAEANRRNRELEREVTGINHSYFKEREARVALEARLAEAMKALELAERMMTKNSLCEAERLETGGRGIRRVREGDTVTRTIQTEFGTAHVTGPAAEVDQQIASMTRRVREGGKVE